MSTLSAELLKLWQKFSFLEVPTSRVHMAVGAGTGIIFGSYVGLHTLFVDKYKNLFQLYKNGFVTSMAPDLTARLNQVADDMNLGPKYRAYLKPFYTIGFDPMHMGSFKLRGGAYIGIPGNFNYKSKDDIEKELIMMQRNAVPWNSEAGDLFQESLILSENAQKFAIAREMCHLNTSYVYNFGLISAVTLHVQYLTAAYLNAKTYGHFKPKSFRYSLYTAIGIFTYGLWSFTTDSLTKYYEEKADKDASALGLNYAKGGVELYTKLARRNIATREMLGAAGEKLFTKYGNPNDEIIRQRHIPVSIRKERAEKRVQEMLEVGQQGRNVESLTYS